jgi:hypothetical protein
MNRLSTWTAVNDLTMTLNCAMRAIIGAREAPFILTPSIALLNLITAELHCPSADKTCLRKCNNSA